MGTFDNFTLTELYYEQKIFPALFIRDEAFPEGESLDDLALRAEVAIRDCVLPHVQILPSVESVESNDLKQEVPAVHVALFSHGNCISEMVSALLRLDPEANCDGNFLGLLNNAAWTRAEIRVRVRFFFFSPLSQQFR